MTQIWRKTKALFKAWFAHMLVYRAELVIWVLVGMLPLVMLAIWIGKAQNAGGSLRGFDSAGFAAYFLAAFLSNQLTVAWAAWELDDHVRQGTFSPKLLRPMHPFWEILARHVTERIVRTPFVLVVVFFGTLLVPGTVIAPDFAHVAVYALSIVLAFCMRLLIAFMIGILCFWFESATAFDEFYWIIFMFVGGSFAPLEFFPQAVRDVLQWTPFPYIAYYPARILTGALPWADTGRVLLAQLAWVAVLWLGMQLMWRMGRQRYGAVGA